ncbi:hypothetical protein HY440_02305 [Candidatus Microgenomates bacterium]|nr:hypothetical protein [Candidatus Microgenomates bacterium]
MALESNTLFLQRQKEKLAKSQLLFKPSRRSYFPGEIVDAELCRLDGSSAGQKRFFIGKSPGSGFAGQVYQAFAPDLEASDSVAVKVLRPKSAWKEAFRDTLHKLSYQTSFPARLREEAVRSGLVWQEIIRTAAAIETGDHEAVVKPLGYFWDGNLNSFAEVQQWVPSRPVKYQAKSADRGPTEMELKRIRMDELVEVCEKVGAIGAATQFRWYTMVSQANVLTRRDGQQTQPDLVAADCRPGLAAPFFLPLSPIHAQISLRGLAKGEFAHFDEVDFKRLDAYVALHPKEFLPLSGLIGQLKKDDVKYRNGRPDLWHRRTKLLVDGGVRAKIREATVGDWELLDKVSPQEALTLRNGAKRYWPYFLIDSLPLGNGVLRVLGNEKYRGHLGKNLTDGKYLGENISAHKAADLLEWADDGRVTFDRARKLDSSTPRYLAEKLVLGWQPEKLHRLETDPVARRDLAYDLFVHPARLFTNRGYREKWLTEIITSRRDEGLITSEEYKLLKSQAGEKEMQRLLDDVGFCVGTELLTKLLYPILGVYGAASGNFLPLGLSATSPISPSGILRELYHLGRTAAEIKTLARRGNEKLLTSKALSAFIAPWRAVGNFFPMSEMALYYDEMSMLLTDYFVRKGIDKVPVFGGEGMLLEYWAFNLFYSWPASMRESVGARLRSLLK